MYKNTEHIVPVTAFGNDGEGICKIDSFTVFVPGAVKGDTAKILVIKEKKNYGYGKLLEIIEPSPLRTTPVCDIFGKCGGCSMQSVSYEAQLEHKKSKVLEALRRIGGFKDAEISSVCGSQPSFNYRNKAQFPVVQTEYGMKAGFYAPHSHRVVVPEKCALQDERINEIVNFVCDWANEMGVCAYDEYSKKGLLRRICVRCGKDEAVVVLVATKRVPYIETLPQKLTEKFPFVKGLVININKDETNNIYGEKDLVIFGEPYIIDSIGDIKYKVHYKSFYQVNPYTTAPLYEKALELANPRGEETVYDLYCGTGSISLFLAKKAKEVIGIEIIPDAVENAKENARLNNIENAQFYCGKAEEVAPELIKEGKIADTVVLDPPRKGCEESLLSSIADMSPSKIIYVSCDCATMARDAKFLASRGYILKEAHGFDQFPHTSHVESVVLLTQMKPDDYVTIELNEED